MDIWDALRIIGRRWYAALPILFVFVVAAFVTSGRVDAEYRATADLILLGPHQSIPEGADIPPQQVNAYLTPCNTCGTMANAIMLALTSSATRDELDSEGWSPHYGIGTEQRTPIMHLEATSRDPDQAIGTIDVVIDRIGSELETRQADVSAPEAQRITTAVLAQDAEPSANNTAATRVRLTLLALGVIAAGVVAFAIEGAAFYLGQRSDRRQGSGPGGNGNGNGRGSHAVRHGPQVPDYEYDPGRIPSGERPRAPQAY